MKKSVVILSAALVALASCQSLKEEWQPVFTFGSNEPGAFEPVYMDDEVNATIADLKALYTQHGTPVEITDELVIMGEVISSDEDGNVYREIYIQDGTGAIDLKLGRSSSYDDFKVGQILYIRCRGLAVGEYGYKSGANYGGGQLQLGLYGDLKTSDDPATLGEKVLSEYETAYVDLVPVINKHVFRGPILPESLRAKPLKGLAGSALTAEENVGRLVTLDGLRYGNSVGGREVFCLFYPDPNLNHTKEESYNRVFLSSPTNRVSGADYTFGITTWALTKTRFAALVGAGVWDDIMVGDDSGRIGTAYTNSEYFGYESLYKDVLLEHPQAQSVSHYFMYDGVEVQVRSSGYARFADVEIPADVRDGSRTISVTGILSRYQGSPQFILLGLPQ